MVSHRSWKVKCLGGLGAIPCGGLLPIPIPCPQWWLEQNLSLQSSAVGAVQWSPHDYKTGYQTLIVSQGRGSQYLRVYHLNRKVGGPSAHTGWPPQVHLVRGTKPILVSMGAEVRLNLWTHWNSCLISTSPHPTQRPESCSSLAYDGGPK